jgi:transcription antitermination factor NusG
VPVLDHEPAVWPEHLFDNDFESSAGDDWRAYQVRPRTEKAVARSFRSRDIAYFLPQIERRKRYQRRFVCSYVVLFPGYVFARLNKQFLARTSESNAIVRSLQIDDQQRLASELREIHRLTQSGQPLTREERLQPGSPARIIRGPLAGLRGQVVKNQRGQRFVLQIHFLQQGVSVEIDSSMIEAI